MYAYLHDIYTISTHIYAPVPVPAAPPPAAAADGGHNERGARAGDRGGGGNLGTVDIDNIYKSIYISTHLGHGGGGGGEGGCLHALGFLVTSLALASHRLQAH